MTSTRKPLHCASSRLKNGKKVVLCKAPPPWVSYRGIRTGYPKQGLPACETCCSMFSLNTETINVRCIRCQRLCLVPATHDARAHRPLPSLSTLSLNTQVWVHIFGACVFLALLYTVASLPEVQAFSHELPAAQANCLSLNATADSTSTCFAPSESAARLSSPIAAALDSLPKLSNLRQTLTALRVEASRVGGASTRALVEARASVLTALDGMREQMRQQLEAAAAPEAGARRRARIQAMQQHAADRLAALSDALLEVKGRLVAQVERAHISEESLGRWPVIVFICAAAMCMLCSSMYHLFMSMGEATALRLKGLDRASISFLILGSYMPAIQFQLCDPSWRLGTTIASALLFVASFTCAALNAGNAISVPIYLTQGALPVVIMSPVWESVASEYLWLSGAIYILGVAIYVSGYPERTTWQHDPRLSCCGSSRRRACLATRRRPFCTSCCRRQAKSGVEEAESVSEDSRKPGNFDLYFASHQLWHICVLFAALMHFVYVWKLFVYRQENACQSA